MEYKLLRGLLGSCLALLVLAGCAALEYSPFEALPSPTAKIPPKSSIVTAQAEETAPTMAQAAELCRVTAAEALNLRAGPGTAYPVTAWLRAGEILIRTTPPAQAAWIEVATEGGVHGWINSTYCEKE